MNFHPEALRRAIQFATAYGSHAGVTGGVADQVFAAASNTGGCVVWRASMLFCSDNPFAAELVARATAPVTPGSGVSVLMSDTSGMIATTPVRFLSGKLETPIFIPSGLGLFFISSQTDSTLAARNVLYTLLS